VFPESSAVTVQLYGSRLCDLTSGFIGGFLGTLLKRGMDNNPTTIAGIYKRTTSHIPEAIPEWQTSCSKDGS
jgi:hypothetical protein